MSDDMARLVNWHNGEKEFSPFSNAEMQRRQDDVRNWMAEQNVDACLFTSYHCINYYSGFLFCYFGRKYGFVITQDGATSISAGIDGGQPWRRTFGDNVTYTDWRKDNYYYAVQSLTKGVKRLGNYVSTIEGRELSRLARQLKEAEQEGALLGVDTIEED